MIMPFRYREYFNRRMEKRKKRIEQGYTGEEKTAKLNLALYGGELPNEEFYYSAF